MRLVSQHRDRLLTIAKCLFIVCSCAGVSFADEYVFVDADNTNLNQDGSSWALAYTYLTDALADVCPVSGPTVYHIWVAEGTYWPDESLADPNGTDDRSASFNICGNVSVYGGFVGNEDPATFDLDNRDLNNHVSILSGDLDGDDTAVLSTHEENSHHVVHIYTGASYDATLDGFTVKGGYTTIPDIDVKDVGWLGGGGIYINIPTDDYTSYQTNATVCNCIITDNFSPKRTIDRVDYGDGGGIYIWGDFDDLSYATIHNCTFSGNGAQYGGGLSCGTGVLDMYECTFEYNDATGDGGGIRIDDPNGGPPTITDCSFLFNTTGDPNDPNDTSGGTGGGMYSAAALTMTDCTFENNYATRGGGGAYIIDSAYARYLNSYISGVVFEGNETTAGGGSGAYSGHGAIFIDCDFIDNVLGKFNNGQLDTLRGAGLYINQSSSDSSFSSWITNCRFIGNTKGATGNSTYGGGAYIWKANVYMLNCLFHDNEATRGGGVGFEMDGDVENRLINCTIADNTAYDDGGGVYCKKVREDDGIAMYNNILWNNDAAGDGDEIYIHSDAAVGSEIAISHSDIDGGINSLYNNSGGNVTVHWSASNINSDPLFADTTNGDYRLRLWSQAIDAGSNVKIPQDLIDMDGDSDTTERAPYDLDWTSRFVDVSEVTDTGTADSPNYPYVIDMGAYELVHCHGDLNYDGSVGAGDLSILITNYGTTSGAAYEDGDLDGDGDVDLSDLGYLNAVYGTTCP